jgi:DNA polymerase-3 subunit gamma/tau
MPILPAIISFAISEIAGGAIAAAVADLGITGAAASAASGALIGGLSGGISAEVTGGNVIKGIESGLVGGGVTGGVSNLVGGALGGAEGVKPTLGGSEALGAGAVKGISNLAGGTAGALATGQPFSSALRSGLISGAAGGIGGAAGEALSLDKYGTGALSGALGYGLGKAFQPSRATSTAQVANLGASGTQIPSTQAPGTSSALGSALFAAPGFGYTPGGPVLGGAGGEDKAPTNVWSSTDKSLRDVGSTVT